MKKYHWVDILGFILIIGAIAGSHCSHAKQIHVAIIDSGISKDTTNLKICPNGLIDLTHTDMVDRIDHGSIVNDIIGDKLKGTDYCLYIIKIYDRKRGIEVFTFENALSLLYRFDYVDIINFSSEGNIEGPYLDEKVLLFGLLQLKGAKFVEAAGNSSRNLDTDCNIYPTCYKDTILVGNGRNRFEHALSSNYGKRINAWRDGNIISINGIVRSSGSSFSAAIYSADLALEMSKKEKK